MRIGMVVGLLWSCVVSGAFAQVDSRVVPGVQVRITRLGPDPQRVIDVFRGLTDSTLLVGAPSAPRSIPLAAIGRLEWQDGRKPSLVGGIVGLVLGFGAGGALGCAANRDSYGVYCAGQSDTKVVLGAALGGVAGAAVGALVFKRPRWRQVEGF